MVISENKDIKFYVRLQKKISNLEVTLIKTAPLYQISL